MSSLRKSLRETPSFDVKTLEWCLMVKRLKLAIMKISGEFLFLFGLLAWVYGVIVQLFHPEWMYAGLSHLTPWIRVDTFTIISFIIAAIGFILWRFARESANSAWKTLPLTTKLFQTVMNVFRLTGIADKYCVYVFSNSLRLSNTAISKQVLLMRMLNLRYIDLEELGFRRAAWLLFFWPINEVITSLKELLKLFICYSIIQEHFDWGTRNVVHLAMKLLRVLGVHVIDGYHTLVDAMVKFVTLPYFSTSVTCEGEY